jgi:hypothetical protein
MLGTLVNLYPAPDSSASKLNDSDYLMRLASVWGDDLLDTLQDAFLDLSPQEPRCSLSERLSSDSIEI